MLCVPNSCIFEHWYYTGVWRKSGGGQAHISDMCQHPRWEAEGPSCSQKCSYELPVQSWQAAAWTGSARGSHDTCLGYFDTWDKFYSKSQSRGLGGAKVLAVGWKWLGWRTQSKKSTKQEILFSDRTLRYSTFYSTGSSIFFLFAHVLDCTGSPLCL